ncbi:hypothetical protein F6R98_10425 [Candidatus Methylospira mobilis]|uniref:DUF968 domain-containing protein n=1 Tax=Candidatus Methylospira mobilis TaxID=1808979 RepID=A0A5Q0BHF0_9GAMM|nr:Ref family recombination enhancement nuclease [Candidatus Methylospira mobilis]QFY42979.1 hypothetical protein F6R98_10425 [Candidatus Methylospira mobilis]
MSTAAEKRYMAQVAALGCAICRRLGLGVTPAQVHHPRADAGMGQRASDFDTIPLCPYHHTGDGGFHALGPVRFAAEYGVTERELTEQTRRDVEQANTDARLW